MHPRNIKLIALDMDGTLLSERKTVSPRSLRAIRAALERGVAVTPVSGRNLETLPRELLEMPEIRYAITCNGARIIDRQSATAVYERLIPLPVALELIDRLAGPECVVEASVGDRLYISCRDAQKELLCVAPELRAHLEKLRRETEDVRTLLVKKGLGVDKVLVFTADGAAHERARCMLAGRGDLTVSFSIRNNLEINAGGCSKGSALQELAGRLGVERSQIMACGDSGNDLAMLEAAGFSVAMGNAVPEVKRVADAVTLTNDEDGVALALERYVLFGETERAAGSGPNS